MVTLWFDWLDLSGGHFPKWPPFYIVHIFSHLETVSLDSLTPKTLVQSQM